MWHVARKCYSCAAATPQVRLTRMPAHASPRCVRLAHPFERPRLSLMHPTHGADPPIGSSCLPSIPQLRPPFPCCLHASLPCLPLPSPTITPQGSARPGHADAGAVRAAGGIHSHLVRNVQNGPHVLQWPVRAAVSLRASWLVERALLVAVPRVSRLCACSGLPHSLSVCKLF